ncbi:GGDEF domain-containing protein [Hydrogenivirga sp.]
MEIPQLTLYRDRFIYIFSFVGITSTLIFGVFQHLKVGNYSSALFEVVLVAIATFNLVYYRRRKNYDLASNVILILMVVVLSFLVATGGLKGTGIYWIYTFPLLSFFMKTYKVATLWNLLLVSCLLAIYFLKHIGVVPSPYNWVHIRQSLGAYGAVFFLSLFYSLILGKLIDSLKEKAIVDALTGLHNRAFMFDVLNKMTALAERENVSFCLAYLDLDNFKRVNDLYGHSEGDTVLKEVAHLLKKHFRKSDVVGRIGGDEFLVIALNCTADKLQERLESIRKNIETFLSAYGISISYGMVEVPKEGLSPSDILRLADERMYLMKSSKKKPKLNSGGKL